MKFSMSVALSAVLSTGVIAYPGMGSGSMGDLHKRMMHERQAPVELIGGLDSDNLTPVGQEVKDCLLETTRGNCEIPGPKTYTAPGPLGSHACAMDTCCVWDYIVEELVGLFLGPDGECTEDARTAIRLGFHDAGAWSKTSGIGGADGSLLLNPEEPSRPENKGLEDIIATGKGLLQKYKGFGIGAADLVQMMATVGTVICPLGPRVISLVGRKDNAASPTGLLPDVHSDAPTLIQLFKDKTISPVDLAALVGAHTTSEQDIVDVNRQGAPQDSTPGVWDVNFYVETVEANAPKEIFKFPSDVALSTAPETAPSFALFGNSGVGQAAWNAAFAKAYVRLSLLGVESINSLTDCTKVLPTAVTAFTPKNGTIPSSSSSTSSSATSSGKPTGKPTLSSTSSSIPSESSSISSSTELTTSTIFSTSSHTTISQGTTKVVTSVIAVSTTVCPVADAHKASPTAISMANIPTAAAASNVALPVAKHPASESAAPIFSLTESTNFPSFSLFPAGSATTAAPVLSSKPKACFTVTTTVTVY